MRNPKHILITGASSGIGAALVLNYAAPGVYLFLHGRNGARLAEVAGAARNKGAIVSTQIGDVTDPAAMGTWIHNCDAQKPLDLVIANAGISAGTGGIAGADADQARAIFATNVSGVLNTIHPALPRMLERRRGQIAIISSLAGFRGFIGAPAYCSSKAAVRVYGEALRGAVRSRGVEVNVVCPGFIKTPMTDVNRFHMPFLIMAEQAAIIIRKGLERDAPRIAFPFRMYVLVRLLAALPQRWLDFILPYMPRKDG
jgi:short-subunit dehydrogenase